MDARPPSRKTYWALALAAVAVPFALHWLGKHRPSRSHDILRAANEAIIATDADYVIVHVNPAATTMFACPAESMQGSALSRFVQFQPAIAGAVPSFFGCDGGRTGRRSSDHAVLGIRADGSTFPLEGSISSLAEAGVPIYTIIVRDVTVRQLVQEQLSRSHEQLRKLSAKLQTIREEERTHIARELHDDLGQLLASLRMDLALLRQQGSAAPASASLMLGMDERMLAAIISLRRIAANLRPRALDEGGLYFALQGLRHEFSERHRIECALFADESELRLDDTMSTAIFRIVQEALTNIARHAQASAVTINLFRVDHHFLLTIKDNGQGIVPTDLDKPLSLGLIGMRERVANLGGEFTVGSDEEMEPPSGTRIDIVLPLAAKKEPATSGPFAHAKH